MGGGRRQSLAGASCQPWRRCGGVDLDRGCARYAHRHIPTGVELAVAHGLQVDCVASFGDLKLIRRTFLSEGLGRLVQKMPTRSAVHFEHSLIADDCVVPETSGADARS